MMSLLSGLCVFVFDLNQGDTFYGKKNKMINCRALHGFVQPVNTADRYAPADFIVPEALRASGTPG